MPPCAWGSVCCSLTHCTFSPSSRRGTRGYVFVIERVTFASSRRGRRRRRSISLCRWCTTPFTSFALTRIRKHCLGSSNRGVHVLFLLLLKKKKIVLH